MESPKGIMRGVTPPDRTSPERTKTATVGRMSRNTRFLKMAKTASVTTNGRFTETLAPLSHCLTPTLDLRNHYTRFKKQKSRKLSDFLKNF
jgi:hypothetical protein